MESIDDKGCVVELVLGSDPSTYQTRFGEVGRNIGISPTTGRSVIVDLANVTWLDSHHLNWLISMQVDVAKRGGEVILVHAQPDVATALGVCMLRSKMYVKTTLQEAYRLLRHDHFLVLEDYLPMVPLFWSHFGSRMVLTTCATLVEAEQAYARYGNDFALIACDACLGSEVDKPNVRPFIEMVRNGGYEGPILAMSGSDSFNKQLKEWGCDSDVLKLHVFDTIHQMFPKKE